MATCWRAAAVAARLVPVALPVGAAGPGRPPRGVARRRRGRRARVAVAEVRRAAAAGAVAARLVGWGAPDHAAGAHDLVAGVVGRALAAGSRADVAHDAVIDFLELPAF